MNCFYQRNRQVGSNKQMSKPFIARGSRVIRCESCLLLKRVCICSHKVECTAHARFWLLMHHNETFKPTNTGRLISDCIHGTESFRWSRTEPDPSFIEALSAPDIDPYIVFPEGEGYEGRMVEFEPKEGRVPVFIILDGTWRQARRMFRHSRYLDDIPVIQPTSSMPTAYRLRKASVPGQLCTAEVASQMLRQIGDVYSADLLSAYFTVFNEHYRAARMSRPLQEDTVEKQLIAKHQKRELAL